MSRTSSVFARQRSMKSVATRKKLPATPAEWEALIAAAPGKDRALTAKEEKEERDASRVDQQASQPQSGLTRPAHPVFAVAFNGVIHLALAALDNLAEHGINADWDQLADAATEEQKDLLIAIGQFWRHVAGSTGQLVSGS